LLPPIVANEASATVPLTFPAYTAMVPPAFAT
jgi:hypothetical protein